MRKPEMARAITNCWISLVPSKMVWIVGRFLETYERSMNTKVFKIKSFYSCDTLSQEMIFLVCPCLKSSAQNLISRPVSERTFKTYQPPRIRPTRRLLTLNQPRKQKQLDEST